MIDYYIGAIIFIYGLIFGSFLNVLIYRIPRKNFFSSVSSYCPECKHKLAWYDLIPVFSYLFLRGRCRYCKEKISVRYPIVELSNAVLWVLSFVFFRNSISDIILSAVLFSLLIVIAGIDLDTQEIPNGLVIAVLVLGVIRFILSFFFGDMLWFEHLIGAACISIPFLIIALITGGGIGGGDIKLCFAVGLFLGWKLTLMGTFLGIILAGIIALVIMIKHKKSGTIPLAPSLCFGFATALLFGNMILELIF